MAMCERCAACLLLWSDDAQHACCRRCRRCRSCRYRLRQLPLSVLLWSTNCCCCCSCCCSVGRGRRACIAPIRVTCLPCRVTVNAVSRVGLSCFRIATSCRRTICLLIEPCDDSGSVQLGSSHGKNSFRVGSSDPAVPYSPSFHLCSLRLSPCIPTAVRT